VKKFATADDGNPISFQVFSNIRNRERIGLLSGTAFESPVWIAFETGRRRLIDLTGELDEANDDEKEQLQKEKIAIEADMSKYNESMERAEKLREVYLQHLKKSNIHPSKAVGVSDFTSGSLCEYGSGGHYEIFTVALCTSKKLDLSGLDDLRPDDQHLGLAPFDEKSVDLPKLEKKKRRTKQEIAESDEKPVKNSTNLRIQLQSLKKTRKIPILSEPETPDTPFIVYFDFVCFKEEHVRQNDVYVRRSVEVLLENRLFIRNEITDFEWFSDGCGKHFKTYKHLNFVSTLKSTYTGLQNVVRRFLPPLQSFNLCDSHYSHRKQEEKKDQQNFHYPSTVEEVVAELHRLSRTYVHVHDPDDLRIDDSPDVDQKDDPFLRLNFEYEVQGTNDFLVRATPAQEAPVRHQLNITNGDRPLTTTEEAAQAFFNESVTWRRAWEPKDDHRVAKKRRRDEEYSLSAGNGDSGDDSDHEPVTPPPTKRRKIDRPER